MTEENQENQGEQPPQYTKAEHESYIEERSRLLDIAAQAALRYDRITLTVASATIALSVTFLSDIAPKPIPSSYWLIIACWVSFILCIVLNLVSWMLTGNAHNRRVKEIEARLRRKKQEESAARQKVTFTNTAIRYFGYLSLISFIFGFAFFVGFASVNLPNKPAKESSKIEKKEVQNVEKGQQVEK